MVTSRMADHVGRVLGGRYRLLAAVGSGASAHVFVADDTVLRRRVAVKLLHAGLADDEGFLKRFRAEATAAANLNHPHVMRVYDWGEDDDGPYLVLEYLGGGSLRDLLDAGRRLSPSQAALVGIETARALDYAHRRGLVHRDIKPANLLFDDEGRLCVADFGLARALAEAAWTEPMGAMLGTARYASPEQARGETVGGRADVYALALVLVEAVTGRVPFAADTTVATLMARANNDLEAPAELGLLADVVERAGTVDTATRSDAADMLRSLEVVTREMPAPGPIPITGSAPIDATRVVDRDPTVLTPRPPKLFDREVHARVDDSGDVEVLPMPLDAGPRRRRRWWKWLLALLLLAGIGVGGAYAAAQLTVPSHPVPTLTGKTLEDAQRIAARDNFDVREVRTRYADGTVAGVILSQDPETGTLKENKAIKVIVSRGPPPVAVPDLSNASESDAVKALEAVGLKPGTITRPNQEDIPKGRVMDYSPKGTKIPKGGAVDMTVSAGPKPRPISDWKGKTFEEAKAGIEASQLVVVRNDVFHDSIAPGLVVSTNPAAGRTAEKGSRVTVNVSKGPEMVDVPDVRNKTVAEARAALVAAKLAVGGEFGPPGRGGAQGVGRVFFTSPAAGTKVKPGTAVSLYYQ